jgi:Domain of unknown function (DUF4174)
MKRLERYPPSYGKPSLAEEEDDKRDQVRPVYGDAAGVDARKLRQEADKPDNTFQAVVIGKDGGVKLRSSDVVTDDKLFGLIDSMPMRKAGQG